jgi:hypothetical protein
MEDETMASIVERSGGRVTGVKCPTCHAELASEDGVAPVHECSVCSNEYCGVRGCGWPEAQLCSNCKEPYIIDAARFNFASSVTWKLYSGDCKPEDLVDLVDAYRIARRETSMVAADRHVRALVRYIERLAEQEDV